MFSRSTLAVAAVAVLTAAGTAVLLWSLDQSATRSAVPFAVVGVSALPFGLTGWGAFRR